MTNYVGNVMLLLDERIGTLLSQVIPTTVKPLSRHLCCLDSP